MAKQNDKNYPELGFVDTECKEGKYLSEDSDSVHSAVTQDGFLDETKNNINKKNQSEIIVIENHGKQRKVGTESSAHDIIDISDESSSEISSSDYNSDTSSELKKVTVTVTTISHRSSHCKKIKKKKVTTIKSKRRVERCIKNKKDIPLRVSNADEKRARAKKTSSLFHKGINKITAHGKNQQQVPLKNKKEQDVSFKLKNDLKPVSKVENVYLVEEIDDEEDSSFAENCTKNDSRVRSSEASESEILTFDDNVPIDMIISGSSENVTPESTKMNEEKKYSQLDIANFCNTNNRGFAKMQLFADNLNDGCRKIMGEEAADNCQEIKETRKEVSADCQDIIVLSDSDEEDNSWFNRSWLNRLSTENSKNLNVHSVKGKKIEQMCGKNDTQFPRQEKTTEAIECNHSHEQNDFNNSAEIQNSSTTRPRFAVQENGVCRDLIQSGYYNNISVCKSASREGFNSNKSVDSKIKEKKDTFDGKRDKKKSAEQKTCDFNNSAGIQNSSVTKTRLPVKENAVSRDVIQSGYCNNPSVSKSASGQDFNSEKSVDRLIKEGKNTFDAKRDQQESAKEIESDFNNSTEIRNSSVSNTRLAVKENAVSRNVIQSGYCNDPSVSKSASGQDFNSEKSVDRLIKEGKNTFDAKRDQQESAKEIESDFNNSTEIRNSSATRPRFAVHENGVCRDLIRSGYYNNVPVCKSSSRQGFNSKKSVYNKTKENKSTFDGKRGQQESAEQDTCDFNNSAKIQNSSGSTARISVQENGFSRDIIQSGYYNNPSISNLGTGQGFNSEKSVDSLIKEEKTNLAAKRDQQDAAKKNESDFNNSTEIRNSSATRPRFAVQENGICRDLIRSGYYNNISVLKSASRQGVNSKTSVNSKIKGKKDPLDGKQDQQESTEKKETSVEKSDKQLHNHTSTLNERTSDGAKRVFTEKKSDANNWFNKGESFCGDKRVEVERWLYDNRYYEDNLAFNDEAADDENRRHQETKTRHNKSVSEEKLLRKKKLRAARKNRLRIRAQHEEMAKKQAEDEKRTDNECRFPEEKRSANERLTANARPCSQEYQLLQKNQIVDQVRFVHGNQTINESQFLPEKRIANENRIPNGSRIVNEHRIPNENQFAGKQQIDIKNQFTPENRSPIKNRTTNESHFPQENRSADMNDSSNIDALEPTIPIETEKKNSECSVISILDSDNGGSVKSQLFCANLDIERRQKIEDMDTEAEDSIEEISESIEENEDIILLSDGDEANNLSYKRPLLDELSVKNCQNFTENLADRKDVAVTCNEDDAHLVPPQKTREAFSKAKLSHECDNYNEKRDFDEHREEDEEQRNSSVLTKRFLTHKNDNSIDFVRTGCDWWDDFVLEPTVDREIEKEKRFAEAKRVRDQQISVTEKTSCKRPYNELLDEQKQRDEKRARITDKSPDKDHCNEGEKVHDEKDADEKHRFKVQFRVRKRSREANRSNESEISRDEKRIYLERSLYDELDFDENRSSTAERANEEDRRREETRERDERILRELERIHSEPETRNEKSVYEENQANRNKSVGEKIRVDGEKSVCNETPVDGETRVCEENLSHVEESVRKKNRAHGEKIACEGNGAHGEEGARKGNRIHDEKRACEDNAAHGEESARKENRANDEKSACEENGAHGEEGARKKNRAHEEKKFFKAKRFDCSKRRYWETQFSEKNRFFNNGQSGKKIHVSQENRFRKKSQPAEKKRPDKFRRFSEEKRPVIERQVSEDKHPNERKFTDEEQRAKERPLSTEKRSPEEKRSAEDKRSAEQKRSDEDKKAVGSGLSPNEEAFCGFDVSRDEYRMFNSRQEHDQRRFPEEKRSGHVNRESPYRVPSDNRENPENRENRVQSRKDDDDEHENWQHDLATYPDVNGTRNRDRILNDPRLKPNSHPIVLIRKLGQIKKPVPIVEPPFLPKGDRRASCSNIINVNRSDDRKDVNAASPSTSQSPQFSVRDFLEETKEEIKKQPKDRDRKLSKRDLARQNTLERKIHVRNQKRRRIKHPWAKILPISTQPSPYLTSEQRENIKAMRRKQLRKIAEQHKSLAREESAVIPVAVSEADDESSSKRVAAQSAKVTEEPRGYFLFSKPLKQRAKKKLEKLRCSPVEKKSEKEINSRFSDVDDKTIDNSDESESEDETQNFATRNSDNMEIVENFASKTKIGQSETIKLTRQQHLPSETRKESEFSKTENHVFFNNKPTEIVEFDFEPGHRMTKFDPKDFTRLQQSTVNNDGNRQLVPDETDKIIYPKIEEFLAHIFQWDPRWLEGRNFPQEQIETKEPPRIVDENKLTAMLSYYRTYEQYYKIVEPLLTLETWYGISRDFEVGKTYLNFFSIVPNSINTIPIYFTNVEVSTLVLEVVCSRRDSVMQEHPVSGDLLFFEYHSNKKDEGGDYASREVFAYVTSLRKTPITSLTNLNRDLINAVKEPHTLLTYTVMTKTLDHTDVQTNRVNRLRTILCLRSNMRTIRALQNLPESPLMNIILHPKFEDYELPAVTNVEAYPLITKDSLNTKQLEAVLKITNAVVQKLPKVCLIQGPPGTGKSKVIVNLVTQILYGEDRFRSDKKLRILVCAPSNAAVDEVVLRLLDVRKSFDQEKCFNIVRTGRIETIHPSARIASLRELAQKRVSEKKNAYPLTSNSDHHDERERFERRTNLRMQREAEEELLKGADVIASTLNSCYTNQMELIFRENADSISVCIVDEATQCAEPENLIPLMLGVKTLVLVGDTNQLPATVLSQKAKKLGLDQSLFARIWRVFEGEPNNPIIRLDTQYRMTVPVMHFPNKYFYAGALTHAAKMHKLPFHFYRVINLDSTQDVNKFSNLNEADFVANLVYTMIARTNYDNAILPVKVGIITPYNSQKSLLRRRINDRVSRLKDKDRIVYEVNTVDSFQGQERDVIIMSCVRSSGIGFLSDRQRLCVALTRAKHSLILCGNFKTFHKDPMWKALLSDAQTRNVYLNVKSNANPGNIRSLIIR